MATLPQSHVGDVESANPRNAGGEQAPATSGGSLGEVTDLEAGANENKPCLGKYVSDCPCRICHLNSDAANQDSGPLFQLGCSCRDDLAVAHKQCAEAWFKIKGNKTCEICGSIAQNVSGTNEAELAQARDGSNNSATTAADSRNIWQNHRVLNFLLACMVFAFVISWLFHFNVRS
ncbi:zinc finger family protein [Dorcoceras hygrometricum]|uniref:Zinc finger family protein n=1 Tax=Dorcoceras hygrometricum TaxID=472368 RepID=A0A2Z7BKE6_9LAMI|nr:zinc finger family protein [Dorcoceras hygrometricum]